MRLRNLLCVIVINIFLMLAVSVTGEYLTLSNRLQQLENTVSTSVETALDSSMASEELFSEKFGQMVLSSGGTLNSPDSFNASAQTRYYNKNTDEFVTGSVYVMSKYYEEYGYFPKRQSDYATYLAGIGEDTIYKWLFGDGGDIIKSEYDTLDWYRTNPSTVQTTRNDAELRSGDRSRVNPDFAEFVKSIGCKMTTVMPLKVRDDVSFELTDAYVPTLANMGLNFGTDAYSNNKMKGSREAAYRSILPVNQSRNYNDAGSGLPMHDNFIMTKHVGKKSNNSGIETSRYYLTPYSLGVTYVPTKVYKPMFIANLQQTCLYNKLKDSDSDVISTFDSGIGCVSTSIYENSDVPLSHVDDDSNIVNDGYIEYDLSTVQCKVDYTMVDFYDDANKDIVTRILGSKASDTPEGTTAEAEATLEETVHELEASDTSTDIYNGLNSENYSKGNRIVARVTTKVKVHIPYNSPILQWIDHLKGLDNTHYGIKMFDPEGGVNGDGQMIEDSDGIWYQYTTYRAISR